MIGKTGAEPVEIILNANRFELNLNRAIYWHEQNALILSDIHIGKGMHFRKSGIPVPKQLFNDDLNTLNELLQFYSPDKLIIVGDMFHSIQNNEINIFDIWRSQYDRLKIHLVKGNHDLLSESKYRELGIEIWDDLGIDGFNFIHHPAKNPKSFCFSGHIHPGVRLEGGARQSLKFPCFYFSEKHCVLPAFSKFTGLAIMNPLPNDSVYAILPQEIVRLKF